MASQSSDGVTQAGQLVALRALQEGRSWVTDKVAQLQDNRRVFGTWRSSLICRPLPLSFVVTSLDHVLPRCLHLPQRVDAIASLPLLLAEHHDKMHVAEDGA